MPEKTKVEPVAVDSVLLICIHTPHVDMHVWHQLLEKFFWNPIWLCHLEISLKFPGFDVIPGASITQCLTRLPPAYEPQLPPPPSNVGQNNSNVQVLHYQDHSPLTWISCLLKNSAWSVFAQFHSLSTLFTILLVFPKITYKISYITK